MELSLAATHFEPDWVVVSGASLVCLFVVASSRLTGGKLFCPWRMFLLANAGGLGISFLGMNPLMEPWATETWLVWGLAVLGYCVGSWITHLVPMSNPGAGGSVVVAASTTTSERRLFVVVTIPFLLAILGGLAAIGTFPVFAEEPELARGQFAFHAPWSGWFLGASMLSFLFGARVLATGGVGVWVYHVLFWTVVALQMLTGIRGAALFGFFCLASQWELLRGKVPMAKIAMGLGLFFVLFIGVALLRMGDAVRFARGIPLETILGVVFGPPYTYIANCFWNLDHGIREVVSGTGHPSTWGFSLTQGIWDAFGVGGDVAKSLGFDTVFNESSAKKKDLNTFSFVWPLFKDGGLPLAVLFPLAWGFCAELVHRLAERGSRSLGLVSSYLTFASLFSFFALYFVVGSYLVFFAITVVLTIALHRSDRTGA